MITPKFISRIALVISAFYLMVSICAEPMPSIAQGTIIGTVFHDSNKNGYLDSGESGVPGVRIATVTGLLIETDAYGRFHITDVNIENHHLGQNQLLKVDLQSLPEGARITSENPRLLRTTNMALDKINFGVVF